MESIFSEEVDTKLNDEIPSTISTDITTEEYLGEILNINQLAEILSYLSLYELMQTNSVNKHFKEATKLCFSHFIECLNLSQFWNIIGSDLACQKIISFILKFPNIKALRFDYCSHLTTDALLPIIRGLTRQNNLCSSLHGLSFFYCPLIDDECIPHIVKFFPNLEYLNLGQCLKLTPNILHHLKKLKFLKTLVLRNNRNFNKDCFTELFDFPSLKQINLTKCDIDDASFIELQQAKEDWIIIGKRHHPRKQLHHSAPPPIVVNNLQYCNEIRTPNQSPLPELEENNPNSKVKFNISKQK